MKPFPSSPQPAPTPSANPSRGGRFAESADMALQQLNNSFHVDHILWREDITASIAHATMLMAQNIIDPADGSDIIAGLEKIRAGIETGAESLDPSQEDIHMAVETRLAGLIGPKAGRLHTARSRNDQVATDFRLWLRAEIDLLSTELTGLMTRLLDRAEENAATVMPGYTHLQPAQPVTLGHHLMAYVAMFRRDRGRLFDARRRLNECPLGAAALAGTSFPIDRHATAQALGFDRPMENSMDAVSARDFAVEFLAAAAILSAHLSRLAEELILWCNPSLGFIRFSDAFSTGSSIMPQKRNPDAAELVRGKTGRIYGALHALLTVLKGLPLTYAKDLQEDKEPVFDTAKTLHLTLAAMRGMMGDFSVNADQMRKAADLGYLTATDLADRLVRDKNYTFRAAHDAVGALVRLAESQGQRLEDLSLAAIRTVIPDADQELLDSLSVEAAVRSRQTYGGTAPVRVLEAIREARQFLMRKNDDET